MIFKKYLGRSHQYLRVLLYHRIARTATKNFLTVRESDLKEQFIYLQQMGYNSILLSDVVNYVYHNQPLPPNPVLITFDDGYKDNFTIMYPLLRDYGMKANIFLVPAFLYNEQINPGTGDNVYLKVEDIHSMDPKLVEFGMHSFDHRSYKTLPPKELDADISLSKAMLMSMGIQFQPCLAFPYGGYPKGNGRLCEFFEVLRNNNIRISFRIGNRLNALPLKNHLLIQRLDVEKHDTLTKFDKAMRKGKLF